MQAWASSRTIASMPWNTRGVSVPAFSSSLGASFASVHELGWETWCLLLDFIQTPIVAEDFRQPSFSIVAFRFWYYIIQDLKLAWKHARASADNNIRHREQREFTPWRRTCMMHSSCMMHMVNFLRNSLLTAADSLMSLELSTDRFLRVVELRQSKANKNPMIRGNHYGSSALKYFKKKA